MKMGLCDVLLMIPGDDAVGAEKETVDCEIAGAEKRRCCDSKLPMLDAHPIVILLERSKQRKMK